MLISNVLLAAHRGAFGDKMAELLIDQSCFGMDLNAALGIESLSIPSDSDFLAFLGDLADPLDPVPAVPAVSALAPPEATAPKPPPLQLPAATEAQTWQVTTAQLLKQPSLRGSPCSSAASAEATNCPDSPMVSSPVTSSEAGLAPASAATAVTAATNTRKRLRAQPSRATPAPSTVTQSTEQTQGTDSEEPPLTKAQLAAAKRRAPVVDWRAINDPEERRKQRRLAKNRVTAARWVQVA